MPFPEIKGEDGRISHCLDSCCIQNLNLNCLGPQQQERKMTVSFIEFGAGTEEALPEFDAKT